MKLRVGGHPLHSRALTIVISQRADGRLDCRGDLIDLRKCGFVPVAGDLQASGVIHNMQVIAVVHPGTRTLERIEAAQPVVAFEPSPITGGESCRGPIERIRALSGARLDAQFDKRLRAEIGGPRGCSHVLTLAHLLGATTTWALDREVEGAFEFEERAEGERVFHRSLVVDGYEPMAGTVELALQLTDLHFAPAPPIAPPMDRFAAQLELRALVRVDMSSGSLAHIEAAERRRSASALESAQWRDRSDDVAGLKGLKALSGLGRELLDRFGERADDRPLLDGLLNLAPALIQCMGSATDDWPARARRNPLLGSGGMPDSCYMWRRDGVLGRALGEEASAGGKILSVRRRSETS